MALRQLADPNYRQKISPEFVSTDMNYLGDMLNFGALYSGSIVRANQAASTMLNKDAALAANVDLDISWELPICRVIGARTNINHRKPVTDPSWSGAVPATAPATVY